MVMDTRSKLLVDHVRLSPMALMSIRQCAGLYHRSPTLYYRPTSTFGVNSGGVFPSSAAIHKGPPSVATFKCIFRRFSGRGWL